MKNLIPLAAILEDLRRAKPYMSQSLHSDFNRVVGLVTNRGLPVLMIDFPDACKILDASLSSGYLDASLLPNSFGERDLTSDRWLFGSLFRELFDEAGSIMNDGAIDITSLFFLRQLLLLYKKVDEVCPPKAVDKAIATFVKIESQMRRPSNQWHLDDGIDTGAPEETSFLDDLDVGPLAQGNETPYVPKGLIRTLEKVCDIVASRLPYPDPMDFIPRHGPGAVSDLKSGADKYLFPYWPRKLNRIFEYQTFAYSSAWIGIIDQLTHSEDEPPAKLIAVPKTLKSPRLIASEPTSHQWMQQATMRWMRENIPHPLQLCFNAVSQEPSRALALASSLTSDNATVDLSSASDRLSCWVVERTFRKSPYFLRILHAVRTRSVLIKYSSDTRGERTMLKKYANQGSAVTFPLQSWIYSLICISAVLFESRLKPTSKNITRAACKVRVFGDDLIIPTEAYIDLWSLLTYLGLEVNESKTHYRGQFRESCGMDAYAGNDISPVYLTSLNKGTSFETLSSSVDVSNNAYLKGLWSLSDVVLMTIDERYRRAIPITFDALGSVSLRTYQKQSFVGNMRGKFDKNTQTCQLRCITPKIVKAKGERSSSQGLLQFFTEYPMDSHPLDFLYPKNWRYGRVLQQRIRLTMRWVAGRSI